MNYLEKVAPSYFEILNPLLKWRILSVKELKNQSGYTGSQSAFYKIVSKLEKNNLVESFMNNWSNEKFLYLKPDALKAFGQEKFLLPVNVDIRFHDAITTKVALFFKSYSFVKDIYLDQEIPKHFPIMEKTPDILVVGEKTKPFKLALEIELTQKSKLRVLDIFKRHSESKIINNIVYITDKKSLFNSYVNYLGELSTSIDCSKFIFIYEKDLNAKTFNLLNSKASYRGKDTSLKELLQI
ncbi:MAG: hypothetical protein H7336_07975 [Bacteriovorax sp.]|nr:hypothetical protein [Bacteriovorax sp.]